MEDLLIGICGRGMRMILLLFLFFHFIFFNVIALIIIETMRRMNSEIKDEMVKNIPLKTLDKQYKTGAMD